jgi:predicted RNase H-like HicB family nuclease
LKHRPGDLEMTKYEVVIYWSDQDQAFVAEAPALPGCAAHGSTQEVALASVKEAIRLWIEMAKELGNPVPQPRGRRLTAA